MRAVIWKKEFSLLNNILRMTQKKVWITWFLYGSLNIKKKNQNQSFTFWRPKKMCARLMNHYVTVSRELTIGFRLCIFCETLHSNKKHFEPEIHIFSGDILTQNRDFLYIVFSTAIIPYFAVQLGPTLACQFIKVCLFWAIDLDPPN